jgi:hypothetical protein
MASLPDYLKVKSAKISKDKTLTCTFIFDIEKYKEALIEEIEEAVEETRELIRYLNNRR